MNELCRMKAEDVNVLWDKLIILECHIQAFTPEKKDLLADVRCFISSLEKNNFIGNR